MKFILISGTPIDGFSYYGPFDTPGEAHDFAENIEENQAEYWVAIINSPENND